MLVSAKLFFPVEVTCQLLACTLKIATCLFHLQKEEHFRYISTHSISTYFETLNQSLLCKITSYNESSTLKLIITVLMVLMYNYQRKFKIKRNVII